MFERFTDRARKVMALANQEAQRFSHEYIGTEHILLGLVKEGSGVGANVLKNLDVDLRKVRLEVEKLVKSGPETVAMGKLPQTPRAKKVLVYAIEEARDLGHNYVGTEHLLLGLLREQDSVAAKVLMSLGVSVEIIREGVTQPGDEKVPVDLGGFAKTAEDQENLVPFSFRFIEQESRYELLDSTGSVIQTKVFGGPVGNYVFNAMSKHEKSQHLLRKAEKLLQRLAIGITATDDIEEVIAQIGCILD